MNEPMQHYLNIAAYHFTPLDDLVTRRKTLKAACDAAELRGTILLSREGINLFIAGLESPLRGFLATLTSTPEFADLEVKESWSDQQPFNRMLVRLKKEIISMGIDGIDPRTRPSPKLKANELKQWLDEGRELTLLDVRNDYEIGVGTFVGARAIGLDHFRHFPTAVEGLPEELKEKPIVMFCTGGIRCEKAGPLMQARGFADVYQLDGGILKYFEECGGAHYQGDCFVFDKRVAVGPDLAESGLGMCFVCQSILTPDEMASPEYVAEKSCSHCYKEQPAPWPSIANRTAAIHAFVTPLPGSTPYDNMRPIRIPERCDGQELMTCLMDVYGHFGEPFWSDELRLERIKLGDRIVTGSEIVRSGQRFAHWFPGTVEPPVSVAIDVLYEDESLLVINKPAPLPMHASGRFSRNTLVWVLRESLQMHGLRPVHRLDANTTGVAVFAKTRHFAGIVQRQFDTGDVTKRYLAEVHGVPSQAEFICDAPISCIASQAGGREIVEHDQAKASEKSLTRFRVREQLTQTCLLEAEPVTGRTNQIRVHLWHLGYPIVGDPLYLPNGKLGEIQTLDPDTVKQNPMRLHAWRVELTHPQTRQRIEMIAPLPSWMSSAILTSLHPSV